MQKSPKTPRMQNPYCVNETDRCTGLHQSVWVSGSYETCNLSPLLVYIHQKTPK